MFINFKFEPGQIFSGSTTGILDLVANISLCGAAISAIVSGSLAPSNSKKTI